MTSRRSRAAPFLRRVSNFNFHLPSFSTSAVLPLVLETSTAESGSLALVDFAPEIIPVAMSFSPETRLAHFQGERKEAFQRTLPVAAIESEVKLGKKRIAEEEVQDKEAKKRKPPPPNPELPDKRKPGPENTIAKKDSEDFILWFKKIALSDMSSYQKRVLTILCQVPRGRYTTYAAISKHLSSSPRAVGNALRNNPFAPHVPCHRVLASGGGLGGFHGSWGRNGKKGLNDDWKRKLLREEGVRFDGKGKVAGSPWESFS
jgi:O-6-methylguanine DNA methyltransferase